MTCVVGFVDKKDGKVWIGADTFASGGFIGNSRDINKVFKSKDCRNVLIGVCGSCRQSDLLEFNSIIDKVDVLENKEINREYMVTKVVPKISSLFANNKSEKTDDGTAIGGTYLFAVGDKLFKMQGDYSINEHKDDYICIGSGMYHADGAMYAIKDISLSPVDKIISALEAAEHHQVNVRRPFVIMNTGDDDVIIID